MEKKYYSFYESLGIVFSDLFLTMRYNPFPRRKKTELPFKFGFIVNVLTFCSYLFYKFIISVFMGRDCKYVINLGYWIAQLFYFASFVAFNLLISFFARMIMKKNQDLFNDWYYMISLLLSDCGLLMAVLALLSVQKKEQRIFMFLTSVFTCTSIYIKTFNAFQGEREFFTDSDLIRYGYLLIFIPFCTIYSFMLVLTPLEGFFVKKIIEYF